MNNSFSSFRLRHYYSLIEPLILKPKVQAYLMIVLSLLAMAFFGWFAIRPTLLTMINLNRQIEEARQTNQKLQEKINALVSAQNEFSNIKPKLPVLFNALPQEPKFTSFLKALTVIASDSGSMLAEQSFQEVNLFQTEKKENSIGFNLLIKGSEPAVNNFIKQLTTLDRLITIERMGLQKEDQLSLTLFGQIYYVQ